VEQKPLWEANRSSANKEVLRTLWNRKVHYRINNSPPSAPVLRQSDPVYAATSDFSKTHFNIIRRKKPRVLFWTYDKASMFISSQESKPRKFNIDRELMGNVVVTELTAFLL
jgi:hypothetical protein